MSGGVTGFFEGLGQRLVSSRDTDFGVRALFAGGALSGKTDSVIAVGVCPEAAVKPRRPGSKPVMMLALVGEQSGRAV